MANIWLVKGGISPGDLLGFLPSIISDKYTGTVAEQIAEGYAHGGGYSPFGEGQWTYDPETQTLQYPGDPPMTPLARTVVRDEIVLLYEASMVCIVQKDGSFAVTRMD